MRRGVMPSLFELHRLRLAFALSSRLTLILPSLPQLLLATYGMELGAWRCCLYPLPVSFLFLPLALAPVLPTATRNVI